MGDFIEVIGIDHGWSNMKTVTQIFTTGVKEITTEPAFFDNVLEWNHHYYKVGGKRLEVRDTKVENENFYLLTLAAAAKELFQRGKQKSTILLSVGLPLTRFGAEKQDFLAYLSKNKEISFRFEKKPYHIKLARVSVFPQCYAAVANRIASLPERAVIVDIGSWTIDILPIYQSYPSESECITLPQGLIRCMREINEECVRQIGQELEESVIQEVMRGKRGTLPERYFNIVIDCIHCFVEKVYNVLKEHGYNLEITPIVFVGGGAVVMKQFGQFAGDNIQYVEDIRANARGYESLGRAYLSAHRNLMETGVR